MHFCCLARLNNSEAGPMKYSTPIFYNSGSQVNLRVFRLIFGYQSHHSFKDREKLCIDGPHKSWYLILLRPWSSGRLLVVHWNTCVCVWDVLILWLIFVLKFFKLVVDILELLTYLWLQGRVSSRSSHYYQRYWTSMVLDFWVEKIKRVKINKVERVKISRPKLSSLAHFHL